MNLEHAFEPGIAFSAEGARVGLVICKQCGAAILIDPRQQDYRRRHLEAHERNDRRPGGRPKKAEAEAKADDSAGVEPEVGEPA
jgi:hypothetical protein